MSGNLERLTDCIDQTRTDRNWQILIESERSRIDIDIAQNGYSEISVDGYSFRIMLKSGS